MYIAVCALTRNPVECSTSAALSIQNRKNIALNPTALTTKYPYNLLYARYNVLSFSSKPHCHFPTCQTENLSRNQKRRSSRNLLMFRLLQAGNNRRCGCAINALNEKGAWVSRRHDQASSSVDGITSAFDTLRVKSPLIFFPTVTSACIHPFSQHIYTHT